MDQAIETQLQRVLDKISDAERQRNRSLVRQTVRLVRAMICLKAFFNNNESERNN
ncbi:MAG: hypothetical protein AB7K68_15080 [Bacteriovoracia bacterium]